MKFEKLGIITFLGKVTGVRYVGLFSDSDKTMQAVNYHTGRFVDYVGYNNEPLYEANEEQKQFLFNALAKENKYYCEKTKTIKEMKKEFTKKDLKSGMWAKTRNGNVYIIVENMTTQLYGNQSFCLIGDGSFIISDDIDDDLTKIDKPDFDIVSLYGNVLGFGDRFTFNFDKQKLIWKRPTEPTQKEKIQAEIDKMQNAIDEMQKELNDLK